MTLKQAIRDVSEGRIARYCAPAQWRVWRDETGVRVEVLHG
jgi:hypothetical protein